jgi:methionine synthase I (cobalamin-dependent)
MHPTLAALLAHGPVLTDGAWGTQLQARGLPVGDFPDAWNLSHPDAVREVAAAYLAAGSQVILTNTFGANRLRLAENGLADQALLINRRGVELSREAASGRARVFASMGPTGKLLMNGDVTEAELSAAYQEQAQALAEAGADGLVIETMADLTEAILAVQAAKATGLPVVGCMVFDSGKNKDRTLMGVTPEQAATALAEAGADVVGANCGQGIAGFVSICQRMRAVTDRPLWMKANAGLPVMEGGRTVYRTTPDEFARFAPELARAGAAFIGGCCGTSPAFIQALRAALPPTVG